MMSVRFVVDVIAVARDHSFAHGRLIEWIASENSRESGFRRRGNVAAHGGHVSQQRSASPS